MPQLCPNKFLTLTSHLPFVDQLMMEITIMTSTDFSLSPKATRQTASTTSFGTHRQSDRPASAIRAGASTMPAAWKSQAGAYESTQHQYGAPVRSILDIVADPFRRAISTKPRKIGLASIATLAMLILIF